jgi:hypothetical protein
MPDQNATTRLTQALDQAQARADEMIAQWVADFKIRAEQVGESRATMDLTLLFGEMASRGKGEGNAALLATAIKKLARRENPK